MLKRDIHSDDELLSLLRADDRKAFTEIYKKYWQDLFNGAYKRLMNREQCQDIVQIVLSDLWRRRNEIFIQDLPAYLHTAVRYQVFRQIARKPSQSVFLDEFEGLITSNDHADENLLEKETLGLVKLWVDALPQKRRAIFLMYSQEELSTREIAAKLGVSQKTVQNQLTTAFHMLKMRLAQFLALVIIAYFFLR